VKTRGLFIVIEGLDGAGTTTQCRLLEQHIRGDKPDQPVHVTAEPSSGPVGALIRQVLTGRVAGTTTLGQAKAFDPHALALLFAADRLDHIATEIEPLLEAGYIVISDRYVMSSLAYQGMDSPMSWVADINRFAPVPDLVVFLEVPAEAGWQRLSGTRPGREIFESPGVLAKVATSYQEAVQMCPAHRMKVLSGTQARDVISRSIWDDVQLMMDAPEGT
jgi:dTMP kinase